jgi:hypothetical protein
MRIRSPGGFPAGQSRKWLVAVFSADGKQLLSTSWVANYGEAKQFAETTLAERSDIKVFVRNPLGGRSFQYVLARDILRGQLTRKKT